MSILSSEQFKALSRAISESFDPDDFTNLLQLELGRPLHDLVALPMKWSPTVTQVVRRAQMEGFERELVLAVAAWRPRNVALAGVLRELVQAPGAETTLALSHATRGAYTSSSGALQGLVRDKSTWAHFDQFLADLALVGPRVCRIESADEVVFGTGFLVGDDCVLTNGHVRDELLRHGAAAASRFDYRRLADSPAERRGMVVPAAEGEAAWIAWSPFAKSDVAEAGIRPTNSELDYALLRIAEPVGRFAPGRDSEGDDEAKARGYYQLDPSATVPGAGADVVVVQHPAGRPLMLAIGQMIAQEIPFRCAHDAPTEAGSSGSPCFDLSLKLRALHHGTDPLDPARPRYNQAVPMGLIAADLAAKGKLP